MISNTCRVKTCYAGQPRKKEEQFEKSVQLKTKKHPTITEGAAVPTERVVSVTPGVAPQLFFGVQVGRERSESVCVGT